MEKTSAKYQPPQTRLSGDLQDTATNIDFRICTKVYEKSQLETRCFEIVHKLGGMLLVKGLNGFYFYDDLVETDEVWFIKAAIAPFVVNS